MFFQGLRPVGDVQVFQVRCSSRPYPLSALFPSSRKGENLLVNACGRSLLQIHLYAVQVGLRKAGFLHYVLVIDIVHVVGKALSGFGKEHGVFIFFHTYSGKPGDSSARSI